MTKHLRIKTKPNCKKILSYVPISCFKVICLNNNDEEIELLIEKSNFKKFKRETEGPQIVNGHTLKDCECGKCPICDWDASICSKCGMAEIELFENQCKNINEYKNI